jgi:hypothetical protein
MVAEECCIFIFPPACQERDERRRAGFKFTGLAFDRGIFVVAAILTNLI